jgi:hypothetical protein
MASWGVRFDFTPSSNLSDPRYVSEWKRYIIRLREDPSSKELVQAAIDLFDPAAPKAAYQDWMVETVGVLQMAVGVEAIERILTSAWVLVRLASVDIILAKVVRLRRSFANYSLSRTNW